MRENPVFVKEVLTKMRGRQSRQVTIALLVVGSMFVLWCYYEATYHLLRYGGYNAGRDGWEVGLVLQGILIWLLAPALTANAISQEREQQTWEMLIFTLLTPREIILGKLAARLLPMVALLAAFFPFMLFCFLRSDVGLAEGLTVYAVFTVWVFFLSTTGLFMSWMFKRTPSAIATSYLVVMSLVVGTVLFNLMISFNNMGWAESPVWWLNPLRVGQALIEMRKDTYAIPVIALSSLTYAALGGFFLWRMLSRFRELSVE